MKKINFDFIPPHFNCINCGSCCGQVPINSKEYNEILNYCKKNHIEPVQKQTLTQCMFRDEKSKKCLIYEVRPIICRLCGVSDGMRCIKGNSNNINGIKFLDSKKDIYGMEKLYKELIQGGN